MNVHKIQKHPNSTSVNFYIVNYVVLNVQSGKVIVVVIQP